MEECLEEFAKDSGSEEYHGCHQKFVFCGDKPEDAKRDNEECVESHKHGMDSVC